MKYTIVKDAGRYRLHRHGIDTGGANNAESEFWDRIEELEADLEVAKAQIGADAALGRMVRELSVHSILARGDRCKGEYAWMLFDGNDHAGTPTATGETPEQALAGRKDG
jgi:hypothetical protein